MAKLKAWIGNYDGRQEAVVVATSQKRAIELLGTTRSDFDTYYEKLDEMPSFVGYEGVWLRAFMQGKPEDWVRQGSPVAR